MEINIEEELKRFRPLVVNTAKRYSGRGAEFDDLMQEGYLALMELIPRCPVRELLPLFLKSRLPGRVRSAARREWRCAERDDFQAFEELEGTVYEPAVQPAEIEDSLTRVLSPEEHHIATLLADGWSQKDVAQKLGVTQQSISARLRRMRSKAAGVI